MMILRTSPEQISANTVRVFWRVGMEKAGIVDVELPDETTDAELIAELCAMRYMVFEREIFDRKPTNGKGYKFICSTGAIRKLVKGKSSKKELWPYARFLAEIMAEAEIVVKKDIGRVDPDDEKTVIEHIFADPKNFTSPVEISIECPTMGTVQVTRHAIERYLECGNRGGDPIKRPINSIEKRLQSPEIRQVEMPKKVVDHKIRKYGDHNKSECWSKPGSTLYFQVNNVNGVRTLVTIFRRVEFF